MINPDAEYEVNADGVSLPHSSKWGHAMVVLSDSIDRIVKICFVFGMAAFAVIMLLGVFFRYVLNNSLIWGDELALIIFIWVILLAIASGYLHGSHVHFDIVTRKLPPFFKSKVQSIAEGLTLGYLLSLMVSGTEVLALAGRLRTDYFLWPFTVAYIAIPIAVVFMFLHWARMNLTTGSAILKLSKVLIGIGFFLLVYFQAPQHLHETGGLRVFLIILSLFGPMFIGVPIAVSLGLMATFYMGLFAELPFQTHATQIFNGINNYTLLAVPLLILSGRLMHAAGIAQLMVDFAQVLVGRVRGGLGAANVVASFLFGDISGSAVSDTAAIGSLMIPQMKARGYHGDFCAALQGAAGSLGMMAPLSITLLLYATATNGSVSRMAMGTILPAFLVGFSFMLYTLWHSKRHNYPSEYVPRKEYLPRTLRALPGIFALVIVVGGIMGGICTPAEVGTILLTYVLLLSIFLYRTATPRMLFDAMVEAGLIAGMTLFMVGTSSFVGFMLARDLVAIGIVDVVSKISLEPFIIVLIISIVVMILGMILEPAPIIFGFLPSFLPLMAQAHVDLVYFGVMFCINMSLGCIVPPVALNLFVSTKLANVRYEEAVRATVPFMIIMGIDYLIMVVFPQIPLWLPHILFDYPMP